MALVRIDQTCSGYLPVLYWGKGENMDREAYSMSYDNVEAADKAGRSWAAAMDVEFRPYQPAERLTPAFVALVKQLREDEGLGLRDAIDRAKAITANDNDAATSDFRQQAES